MEHILSVKDISKTIGKKKLICSTSIALESLIRSAVGRY